MSFSRRSFMSGFCSLVFARFKLAIDASSAREIVALSNSTDVRGIDFRPFCKYGFEYAMLYSDGYAEKSSTRVRGAEPRESAKREAASCSLLDAS